MDFSREVSLTKQGMMHIEGEGNETCILGSMGGDLLMNHAKCPKGW